MRPRNSKHHILHFSTDWTARPQAEYLREQPTLIPRLNQDIHDVVHRVAPGVPLLGPHALMQVAADFVPGRDTLESIDNLLFSIYAAAEHPRAHRIERDLGHLAIEAIILQRDVIRGNVIE